MGHVWNSKVPKSLMMDEISRFCASYCRFCENYNLERSYIVQILPPLSHNAYFQIECTRKNSGQKRALALLLCFTSFDRRLEPFSPFELSSAQNCKGLWSNGLETEFNLQFGKWLASSNSMKNIGQSATTDVRSRGGLKFDDGSSKNTWTIRFWLGSLPLLSRVYLAILK